MSRAALKISFHGIVRNKIIEIIKSSAEPRVKRYKTFFAESPGKRYFLTCEFMEIIKKIYEARNIIYKVEAIICIKKL